MKNLRLVFVVLSIFVVGGIFFIMPAFAQDDVGKDKSLIPPERENKGIETIPALTTGGPDAYGYTYADSLEPSCTTTFNDISGINLGLGLTDESEINVTLPFPFTFYGTTATEIRIENNGGILFNLGGNLGFTNGSLPSTSSGLANGAILPLWDDLNGTAGDVYTATVGSAPNRQFIVQWDQRPHYNLAASAVTFQVVLYEGSNYIDFVYQDIIFGDVAYDNGANATVGIQQDSTNALQYSFNMPSLADGRAICFYPPSGPDITLQKTVGIDPSSCATTDAISIGPGQNVTYCYEVTNTGTITLDNHNLFDDHLGNILSGALLSLPPGASTFITQSATIMTDTTNMATWTAYNTGPTDVVSSTNSATVNVIPPDTYGYIIDTGCSVSFTDISGVNPDLGLTVDALTNVTLPFAFNFYGVSSTDIVISNNGAILFDATTGAVSFSNTALPTTSGDLENGSILPFWDDLDDDMGGVYTATTGIAPNRQFIIQWHQRPHYSSTGGIGEVTFQVVLHEGSNNIDFIYQDIVFGDAGYDNGASATIGLEQNATNALQYSYDTMSLVDGQALCFTPPSGPRIELQKTVGLDTSSCATTDTLLIKPGTDVTYCYEVTNAGTITLTQHDLMDSELGNIFSGLTYDLAPGASTFVTQTATILTDTVNTSTWTAYNVGPIDVVSATATVTVNVINTAAFPTCADFETGTLPTFMVTETTSAAAANGRVQVTTAFPHMGSYALDLDTDCSGCGGETQQAVIMGVDLFGQTDVLLDFWVQEHGDENDPEDGVFISDNGGETWTQIVNLNDFPGTYTKVTVDLVTATTSAGMNLVDGFLIKFQSKDDFSISTDGYSFDDICVQANIPPVANDDSYTGFAGTTLIANAPGVLGNDTDADSSPSPLTAMTITNPITGSLVFNNDGSFAYTSPMGYSGVVTFTYVATDGSDTSNIATVTITVGDVPAIVINEIMQNPSAVADVSGEWFELYNAGTSNVDLNGWVLSDNVGNHPITSSLVITSGGYLVLCRNGDTLTNGGVTCDYEYGDDLQIANGADNVTLTSGGVTIDDVSYDGGPLFPDPAGRSMCLINPALDNSIGGNWLESITVYGSGDAGTPGMVNSDCVAPIAVDDNYTTAVDTTLMVTTTSGLIANDSNVLNVAVDTAPFTGTLDLQPDGSFVYTPSVGFSGIVTFTYTGFRASSSDMALVTITVGSGCAAVVPAVVMMSYSGMDVILTWTPDTDNDNYAIYRSTTPYFTPDASTLVTTLPSTTGMYTDVGMAGNAGTNYYYYVRAINCGGTQTVDSDHSAEFDFAIVPGS